MSHYRHDTVHGPVGIETDDHEILAIKVGDTRPTTDPAVPLAVEAARQIDEFYAGKRKRLDLPFTIEGTEFQKRVVIAVTRIPYGETRSYAEIARAAGHPNAFRAVGSVMAANEMHLLVPCHRVVKSGGATGLYGGGESFKEMLLAFEAEHRDR
ncbi:MAG: hypothetical protein A2Y16_00750 [Tenericutes bacterium GWF2_57_13]|nr:MAG: hypothetical protein A2Y16_00750 [Tenericutes bacterium GWF2_57_13]